MFDTTEQTLIVYSDNKCSITKITYPNSNLIDVHLNYYAKKYLISKILTKENYEIITPEYEHIYCDYIRFLFYMKQLEIPENICTLFLEACNDKKE